MNESDALRRAGLILRKRALLDEAMRKLVHEVRYDICTGYYDVLTMARADRMRTIWFLRECGLCPNLLEAKWRVDGLLAKAAAAEAEAKGAKSP